MNENEEATVYAESIDKFNFLTSVLNYTETGISFKGETKIDDKMSVLTDKEIACKTPEESSVTYQKVMEMRELTESEGEQVNGIRNKLRKIFKVVFKDSKLLLIYSLSMFLLGILDITFDNYFQLFFKVACVLFVLGPKRLFNEVKKIVTSPKRREELQKYLNEHHIGGYVDSVDKDEDIKLYVKVNNN